MPSSLLSSTNGRTTSGMTCHLVFGKHTRSNDIGMACPQRLRTAHKEGRRRAWHDITSFGQRTRSNNVGRDMSSPPLESTHGRPKSGVACHHHHWATHTVELRRACHAIIAYGQHKRSNDVRRDMPSSPLESTHGRTTSGVACHHNL